MCAMTFALSRTPRLARLSAVYCLGTAVFALDYGLLASGWSSATPTHRFVFSILHASLLLAECVEFILMPMRGVDLAYNVAGALGLALVWLPDVAFTADLSAAAAAHGWHAFENHIDPIWGMGRIVAMGPQLHVGPTPWATIRATVTTCSVVGFGVATAALTAFGWRAVPLLKHVHKKWFPPPGDRVRGGVLVHVVRHLHPAGDRQPGGGSLRVRAGHDRRVCGYSRGRAAAGVAAGRRGEPCG